jgi:alanyl-tRNA synthetase
MGVDRLYYSDSYLREFPARVVARDGVRLYLDRTAFYPTSGGQPSDTGFIGGVAVVDVIDEDGQIAHLMEAPVEDGEVHCAIDWPRRFDHMQQHSGQHLLSAIFVEMYGYQTVSFHLGKESSTIDLDVPAVSAEQIAAAEQWANQTVFENRAIAAAFEENPADLRKSSARHGALRIVSIRDLDRSACGGTHVRATGEIGPILIRRQEKIRNTLRIEFLCGMRAVRRARADYDALSRVAPVFSSTLDDAPGLVAAQREALDGAEKTRRKLEEEAARYRAKELYEATPPDAGGLRRMVRRGGHRMEDLRLLAQNFTSHPRAIFVGAVDEPPSVLLAASADSGLDAGKTLKDLLAASGGRGGGSARMAQGSVPDRAALDRIIQTI